MAEVPERSGSGMVQITIGDVKSNSIYFDVFHIIEIFPDSGDVGSSFYIKGEGFGNNQSDSEVRLGDIETHVSTWSDTLIFAEVPTGVISDSIVVYRNGLLSNGKYFRISSQSEYPVIDSISADTVGYSQWLDVWGSNFGDGKGNSYLSVGGAHWSDSCLWGPWDPPCWWYDHHLIGRVWAKADPGEIETTDIFVVAHGAKSNVVHAVLLGAPIIHDVYPDTVVYGDEIQITGSLFLDRRGVVRIGSKKAESLVWSDELITAIVPEGARSSHLSVHSQGGGAEFPLHVVAVLNLSPNLAFVGDTVGVIGCGFGDEQGSNSVTLGAEEITVLSWSDRLIEFEVTDQMSSGDVRVAVGSVISNTAYLDANPSLPDLTPYLLQTNSFEVNFSGTIGTTAGGWADIIITLLVQQFDPGSGFEECTTSWESNDFHGVRTTDCVQAHPCVQQRWLDGSISAGGLSVDSVHCRYTDERDEIVGGLTHVHHESREFTLIDVPVSYVSVDDSIVIRYELSGATVRDHMADIFMSVWHYEYSDFYPPFPPHEIEYSWTFSHVFWDHPPNPPRIRITFRKTD